MSDEETMSICTICHKPKQSGLYTSGDGYGDAKHVGIESLPFEFYCWGCVKAHPEQIPNQDAKIDAAFAARGWCGFLEAWIGRCREVQPCPKHSGEQCWKCKERATSNCPNTSALVCGVPQCQQHPHSEYHREQYEAVQLKRKQQKVIDLRAEADTLERELTQ